jgi:hypothetical protein
VNLPAGLAVVVGILVVFPLVAVWVSRFWRDPPPAKWGLTPEQRAAAANSPERAEAAVVANAAG